MNDPTPVIETERLILRGRTMADFPAYAALWADPAVTRYTAGQPISEEDAWLKFTRMAGTWMLKGYGFWIVEEKENRALIGEVGVAEFKRDITPSLIGKPEFGWVLTPSVHGRGYATEAAKAALAWADERFPHAVMSCIIDEANAPSFRVAAKCGFCEAARTAYKGKPIVVLMRRRG